MFRDVFRVGLSLILTGLVFLGSPSYAQDSKLAGTYDGIDAARGLQIVLSQIGEDIRGRIAAPDGSGEDLVGKANGDRFQSPLTYQAKPGIAQIIAKPLGISLVWAPVDSANRPTQGNEVVFVFRRKELELPVPSAAFTEAPKVTGRNPSAIDFLNSYQFWEPNDVSRVYDAIDGRFKILMEFFPAVRADIIWKMCQSDTGGKALASALRGSGVTCKQMLTQLRQAQTDGRFNAYKDRVQTETEHALYAVECALGIHLPKVCAASAERTRSFAMSAETVATVMSKL